jgi:predicted GH43/DUF377 family glycosyl hydrolase
MRKLFLLILSLILTSYSCKKNIIETEEINNKKGTILLKIDKEAAPENVVSVKAYLTRTGYSTITGDLNLISDSTAELSLDQIPVGLWHLKVDAINENNAVIYTGETDVIVQENLTVSVYLELIPTGSGFGNIEIYVVWGNNFLWKDYHQNPIFTRNHSSILPAGGVSDATIILDNNVYKMWYLNILEAGAGNIGYAESVNGIEWTVIKPVSLERTLGGNWDSWVVAPGSVIKENNSYKLYYSGLSLNGQYSIGLATSSDGINWTKRANPVLYSTNTEVALSTPEVVKKGSLYYMYYHYKSSNSFEHKISVAISTDGINWERYGNNPIIVKSLGWEVNGIIHPSVFLENDILKMVYFTGDRKKFGFASSSDGFNWTKDSNPIFTVDMVFNNWTNNINHPYFRKFGNEYRIYYTATINSTNTIGLTRKIESK